MYKLKKKNGKVFTIKSVGTGPLSYEKRIYRATVSQRLRNATLEEPAASIFRAGVTETVGSPKSLVTRY
jgi:hypothetical protein